MEYLANRMGLIFMKINGPALGHEVTSLDPEEAPTLVHVRRKKLNLALEMGDNVMIYVDDISTVIRSFCRSLFRCVMPSARSRAYGVVSRRRTTCAVAAWWW